MIRLCPATAQSRIFTKINSRWVPQPDSHLVHVSQLNLTRLGNPNTGSQWAVSQAWVSGSLG